jgi:hypothetical protein
MAKAHVASRGARRDDSRKGYPTPRCFLRKSAETIEKKRVEFFLSAKKRKRVRKDVKRKNLSSAASGRF